MARPRILLALLLVAPLVPCSARGEPDDEKKKLDGPPSEDESPKPGSGD